MAETGAEGISPLEQQKETILNILFDQQESLREKGVVDAMVYEQQKGEGYFLIWGKNDQDLRNMVLVTEWNSRGTGRELVVSYSDLENGATLADGKNWDMALMPAQAEYVDVLRKYGVDLNKQMSLEDKISRAVENSQATREIDIDEEGNVLDSSKRGWEISGRPVTK